MKKKKKNPCRIPVSQADINKAKKETQTMAVNYVLAIFFTVMRDKEGYDNKQLSKLWKEVNDLSDSVAKGYVSIEDLINTLEEEAGIRIE